MSINKFYLNITNKRIYIYRFVLYTDGDKKVGYSSSFISNYEFN